MPSLGHRLEQIAGRVAGSKTAEKTGKAPGTERLEPVLHGTEREWHSTTSYRLFQAPEDVVEEPKKGKLAALGKHFAWGSVTFVTGEVYFRCEAPGYEPEYGNEYDYGYGGGYEGYGGGYGYDDYGYGGAEDYGGGEYLEEESPLISTAPAAPSHKALQEPRLWCH
ncbi:unnamed protein product [Durusdinium trenchii]|uniref:Uncharacterized protein n=1 Tax=Durusdinium trenchii TaxID=1381693 RepID=A0ABP0PQB9_9DINO